MAIIDRENKLRENFEGKLTFTNLLSKYIFLTCFIGSIGFFGCNAHANHSDNSKGTNMKEIKVGDIIPDIVLKDQTGKLFDLKSETKGKNVVLYFYPMDNTKGCTAQACSFRDQYEDFVDANAVVIGISGQSAESHKNFAEEHNLPFTLLSDEKNKVRKMFGVPSNLLGLLPGRVTYVINKENKVVYTFNSQTKIQEHIDNSLNILNKE